MISLFHIFFVKEKALNCFYHFIFHVGLYYLFHFDLYNAAWENSNYYAADCGLRELVEIVFPRTRTIPFLPDWSIDGIIRYVM